jgi:hypothetical protein
MFPHFCHPTLKTMKHQSPLRTFRSFLPILVFALPGMLAAQEDLTTEDRNAVKQALKGADVDTTKVWTTGGLFQLNFSQVQLINWAAGGASSVSGLAQVNLFARMRKDKWAWDNSLILAYGALNEEGRATRKTDDRLELNSRLGYKMSEHWYGSALFQFRTQFLEGFDAAVDTLRISNFMAPGYVLFGLGFDYKSSDKFSFYVSPAMTKTTFVTDQSLYYGNNDLLLYGVKAGENSVFQFGAYSNIYFTTPLAENISFTTRLELFSNYLDKPQNIDVNWENLFNFKVNKWFAATLGTLLIYDHEIDIVREDAEGVLKTGPATQFKQTLALGITAKF